MNLELSTLTPTDLGAVDDLMKRNRHTLGFLPTEALLDYLAKGGVLGAKNSSNQLAGYLIYASSTNRFRIVQLCVSSQFRGKGVARSLLNMLEDSATTQTAIKLSCRRDFSAHKVWPKLGFVPIGERPGRSAAGHLLTVWHLVLKTGNQMDLGLFQAQTSDEALDAIIDAQVFFDLYEQPSAKSEPSKSLLSDFLIDSLNIWITDELFVEIDRNNDPEQRKLGRERMQRFPQATYSPRLADTNVGILRTILPHARASQESDIRQLAKAASSDVNVFVTRDEALLRMAQDIVALTNLRVVSPIELILQLHELHEGQSYTPDRVSGFDLGWHRVTSKDLESLPIHTFLNKEEKHGHFKETLNRYLASPSRYECQLLKAGDDVSAIRILPSNPTGVVTVPFARVAASNDRSLFGRFLVADTIARAVVENQEMVEFDTSAISPSLVQGLLEMGFTRCEDRFVRFCFARCLDRQEVIERIRELLPESRRDYQNMSDDELQSHCSPLSLNTNQNYFLIPIRPGYALSLIDRQQSSIDLFGGDPNVLLRWSNVYYRKATNQRMLKAPARILWYVSRDQKHIIAISTLDKVSIDTPKELLRKFKRFGVLEWKDLYEMCNGDTSSKLMALEFSHTFLFNRRIPLEKIRAIYKEDSVGLSLQSASRIPAKTFRKLFQLGFSNN